MMTLQTEMTNQMVAYHQERLKASMRAAESDRAVILKYRARIGSLLITLGQRLRGEGVRELIASSPSPGTASSLRMPPQGGHA